MTLVHLTTCFLGWELSSKVQTILGTFVRSLVEWTALDDYKVLDGDFQRTRRAPKERSRRALRERWTLHYE